ncbi:hypothetical protein GE061_002149 [Apolygus lucorum]|uniref:EGF-like domain-containing protein n=1 Tax=Apolygus lucorum TaxID=248454 RepID=A0A8S9X5P5_APOLU|nr:hypothetical protein GE061_002149 [Apolygus lucorum]
MIYYWVLPFILCITGVAAISSSNGVCKTEIKVPRIEKVTYTEKKRCASYESCWYRNVKKTKSQVAFDTHNSYYCCPGYKKKGPTGLELNTTAISCEPVCSDPCVNGKCSSPGKCDCLPGFRKTKSDHICEPVCEPACINAECEPGNKCTCHIGYEKVGDKCNPICSDGCVDGYCLKPEICACNASYILSLNEPVCKRDCENGKCVAPNRCECFEGHVEGEDWNLCKPYCPEPCENPWCTAPNVCTCFEGYDQLVGENRSHQCVPRCSTECLNGECIAPDECGCNQGFEMDLDEQQCVPLCSNGCDNGICVATEKCSCNKGYRNSNESCIPHCDHPCVNGDCTAPNECTCNNGTLKASTYHCLLTCANTRQDRCFHESLVPMTSSLIQHSDTSEMPYIDFIGTTSLC